MLKIAITGNIASGKSQAEKVLSELGYPVYDADKIAHIVLESLESFYDYDVFTNNKIDRKKLGNLVFSNPDIKKKLEDLTHPKIKNHILNLFEKHKDEEFIFISVPLLFEANFDDIFDKILLITSDSETQLSRLMKRNNFSKEEALARINSQQPQEEKEKKADYIIRNDSSLTYLENQISAFIKILKQGN